ncbi:MAG TPA: SDR family oxidoreductase [Thermopetrobacter sp.]|nr:SDR family oxidoreductase [Thermopetrobacter sp.]
MNRIWTEQGPRRALITGASSGIGEAFARLLAAEGGWQLALVARNEEQLFRLAGVLRAQHLTVSHVLPLDLAEGDAPARLMAMLAEKDFAPDVLINNAGIGLAGAAATLPLEAQMRIIDVNVRAASELALRCLPGMRARGRGGIINVSSLSAFMPGPGMAVYFASKAYLLSFSEALAEEVRRDGLTVTALCPGPVRTRFQERAGMERLWLARLMMRARPEQVARAGWQAFKEGRVVVVPGFFNALMSVAVKMTPRALIRSSTHALLKAGGGRRRGGRDDAGGGDGGGAAPGGGGAPPAGREGGA